MHFQTVKLMVRNLEFGVHNKFSIFQFSFFLSIAVERFPLFERDAREANTNSIERARGAGPVPSNIKLQDHNHNREVIFALPSLRLHFKSEHYQPLNVDIRREFWQVFKNFHCFTNEFCFPKQKKNHLLNAASLLSLRITFS